MNRFLSSSYLVFVQPSSCPPLCLGDVTRPTRLLPPGKSQLPGSRRFWNPA